MTNASTSRKHIAPAFELPPAGIDFKSGPRRITTQQRILTCIEQHPGIHFRALARACSCTIGQAQYHIHRLAKKGEIVKFKSFRCSCFCTREVSASLRPIYAILHHGACRKIILHLLIHNGKHCAELSKHTSLSKSALSYYLLRLKSSGLIEEKRHGTNKCIHLRDSSAISHAVNCAAHLH